MLLDEGAGDCRLTEKISLISEISVAAGQKQSSVCVADWKLQPVPTARQIGSFPAV